jgi:Fe(3+) dicitrate transport protein
MSVSRAAFAGLGWLIAALPSGPAAAQQPATQPAPALPARSGKGTLVASVAVKPHREDTRAKLEHIMREVEGAKITVTRKSSMTPLAQQPTPESADPRAVFARLPGLEIADIQTPTRVELSYRGLGDAGGSGSVSLLQDGVPIADDWIASPMLSYLPLAQGVSQAQMIRGGSSLLYGTGLAGSVNLVSKTPRPGEPMTGYSEQVGGSDGYYSTYNVVEGSRGDFDYRVALGGWETDGERVNSRATAREGDAYLAWRPTSHQLWYIDLHAYAADAGDPGGLGEAQFRADPDAASTPDSHDWVSRFSATLGDETDLGNGWRFEGKAWATYQDLFARSVADAATDVSAPGTATLQDEAFQSEGADLRMRKSWDHGNNFTFGATIYHDSSPLTQWLGDDPSAGDGDHAGAAPILREGRGDTDASVFAENVFRLPWRVHVVPSVRLEHETVDVGETIAPPYPGRPPVDAQAVHNTPLLGLGVGNDFGKDNETYFSVTQGYRPVGFLDLGSPFTQAQPTYSAKPSESLTWEAGVHGTPLRGLFYDASLFWIEVRDRVETEIVGPAPFDIADVDTGNTRNRGFEGELVYDFLAGRPGGRHLSAFVDLTLLDAEFVKSSIPGQVGRTPAYAPHTLAKAGLTWRRDGHYSVSLTGVSVGSQYFQDSDQAAGTGASFVPARIPAYAVLDLSGDVQLTRRVRLLGGVSNLGGERYYARAFTDGIEPAAGRTVYAGLALGF